MSSSESSDDDIEEIITGPSLKEGRYIPHPGNPNPTHAQFANSTKKNHFLDDLWNVGTLIYSLKEPEKSLPLNEGLEDKILRFDSRFESGNLNYVYQIGVDTYHMVLEYDRNGSGSCQWFYFQMSNVRKDTKYTFYISGFHKNSGVYKAGSKVFWYSATQAAKQNISWSRGGTSYSYGVTLRDKKTKRSTLHFQMKFPYDNDTVFLCYALPYTFTELKQNISRWVISSKGVCQASVLCTTLGGRECPLLTLTSKTSNVPMSQRECIFLTARIHPGESNSSVVLHGLIEFLLSPHPAAKYILDNCIVKIVPMINVDGVIEGFYRIGLAGCDLNRVWSSPDPERHPVVCAIKKLVTQIATERKISIYIDFHGHSRLHGTFAYGCPNDDNLELRDKEKQFPRMLSFLSDAFAWGRCVFSFPKERKAASRIVMRKEINVIHSYTIESSFGGIQNGPRAEILYDEIIWHELGSKCGEAIYHMITKENSPLYRFVQQELVYLSPQPEAEKTESTPTDSQVAQMNNDTHDDFSYFGPSRNRGNQPVLLKLRQPTTFLTANSRIISSKTPGYIAPKWAQMQFTPRF